MCCEEPCNVFHLRASVTCDVQFSKHLSWRQVERGAELMEILTPKSLLFYVMNRNYPVLRGEGVWKESFGVFVTVIPRRRNDTAGQTDVMTSD
jgi:hypothetical protein